VRGVPSVVAGGEVFWGDDRLEEAAAAASSAA
jgi:2-hydroxychromene-2-carboxylate isomerase